MGVEGIDMLLGLMQMICEQLQMLIEWMDSVVVSINKEKGDRHPGLWELQVGIIYSIICLKSVDVRTMQFVILAHSPREMSQTDRIHPMYFLLRVRVSIRPRYFVNAKKP